MPDLPTSYLGLLSLIVVGLGGAVAAVARWLHPRLDAVLASIPESTKNQAKTNESLTSLTTSFAILSRIMTAQHAEMSRNQKQIVIVEDNPQESQQVINACAEIARKYRLSIKDVSTLSEAHALLATAVVIVLDAKLPDGSIDSVNAMINISPVPVIVYSASEVSRETFPRAFRVIKATGNEELQASLRQAVDAAIMQSIAIQ